MFRQLAASKNRRAHALLVLVLGILATTFAPTSVRQLLFAKVKTSLSCRVSNIVTRPTGPETDTFLANASELLPVIPRPGSEFSYRFDDYPTSTELGAFLAELAARFPDHVTVREIGRSWQGRPIMSVRVAIPSDVPPDERPALYLDGQHHAREAISSLAVLYAVWYLAHHAEQDPELQNLLSTGTVYALPSVNPDGNDIFLADDQWLRKNVNPLVGDDDGDGLVDEDPRRTQGFSTVKPKRITFNLAWIAEHGDFPLVPGWQENVVEAREPLDQDHQNSSIRELDDDGDGLVDEDPVGGVDLNRNYDSHWAVGSAPVEDEQFGGSVPFSEPETRAVRDFVLAHPNIRLAASYHSGSDILLHPWGWTSTEPVPDAVVYEVLSRKGARLTARNGFRATIYGAPAQVLYSGGGSSMDWLYEQGILVWTPEIYAGSPIVQIERIAASNSFTLTHTFAAQFNPPADEILLTVERWLPWNLFLLDLLGKADSKQQANLPTTVARSMTNDYISFWDRMQAYGSILWSWRCR